jgi:tetratricopeptide (TPR) repeat protein
MKGFFSFLIMCSLCMANVTGVKASTLHHQLRTPPLLIASIEAKVQEYIQSGFNAIAEGDDYHALKEAAPEAKMFETDHKFNSYSEATSFFESALQLNPQSKEAHYGMGIALFRMYFLRGRTVDTWLQFPDINTVIDYLSRARQLDANDPNVSSELGQALLEAGDLKRSLNYSQEALTLQTKEPWRALANIGMVYYKMMQQNPAQGEPYFAQAQAAWKESISLVPPEKAYISFLTYQWLGEMHQMGAVEFGYDGASEAEAQSYMAKAEELYQQSPEQIALREAEQQHQLQQTRNNEAAARESEKAESWLHRPCTPDPSGGSFTRHMCMEGYIDPNDPRGADQPMPSDWQL